MARRSDFLQQSLVTDNLKISKAKEIDLQGLGEDNLSALQLHLHDVNEERRPERRLKSDIFDSQNLETFSRSKTSSKRCCSSVMIGIFIVVSLASLFINVLMVKGVIVPSGCQRIERRKGWYYAMMLCYSCVICYSYLANILPHIIHMPCVRYIC